MKCVICRNGDTCSGTTTITLVRNQTTLVVKSVPAQICDNCGEEYVDEHIAATLLEQINSAARSGAEVTISHYVAA